MIPAIGGDSEWSPPSQSEGKRLFLLPCDELIALAARMKGMYRMSLADAWVLATAKQLNATLVHKDPGSSKQPQKFSFNPSPIVK